MSGGSPASIVEAFSRRVVDMKTREPLSPGEVGEIEMCGPHRFEGYWYRPDVTEKSFDEDAGSGPETWDS